MPENTRGFMRPSSRPPSYCTIRPADSNPDQDRTMVPVSSNEESITIVSTRTVDRVPGPAGPEAIPGGPAHYIALALMGLHHPHAIVTGATAEVEVRLTAN